MYVRTFKIATQLIIVRSVRGTNLRQEQFSAFVALPLGQSDSLSDLSSFKNDHNSSVTLTQLLFDYRTSTCCFTCEVTNAIIQQ
jgi:hypothetical protein